MRHLTLIVVKVGCEIEREEGVATKGKLFQVNSVSQVGVEMLCTVYNRLDIFTCVLLCVGLVQLTIG